MASNDFVPVAPGPGANVASQSTYLADPATSTGNVSGVAKSAIVNKSLRQGTVMASVLAQLIVDNTGQNAVDDGTTATLLANLKTATSGRLLRRSVYYRAPGSHINMVAIDSGAGTTTGATTWTKQATTKKVIVYVAAAGGGGGGCSASAANQVCAAAGGGAGGYAEAIITDPTILNATQTVSVGLQGSGGASGANNGGAGGSSSFGSGVTTTGGNGGSAATSVTNFVGKGGDGGTSLGGTLTLAVNCSGQQGLPSVAFSYLNAVSGAGAPSVRWGGGGNGLGLPGGAGNFASAPGAGGSGALAANGIGAQPGGPGADGVVIVEEYA